MKKGRIEFKGKMQYTGINLKKKLHKETRRIVGGKKLECNILPTIKIKWLTACFLMKSLSSLCLEKRQVALDEGEMIILMC